MMEFLYPIITWSFAYPAVLLAPFIIMFAARIRNSKPSALGHPQVSALRELPTSLRALLRGPVLRTLSAVAIVMLALAAARPQRVTVRDQEREARNLVLAIDLSRSMSARDFRAEFGTMTRIEAARQVIGEFLKARKGDRIGIVVFGSTAMLLSPLTSDTNLLLQLVEKLRLGIAQDGTAIGDGLGLALKRLRDITSGTRAVILMTDGVSNSGQINPLKAAKVAADLGIKVHTIGIGSNQPVTLRSPGNIFFQHNVSQVEFDEKTLKEIAQLTGGVYFNAQSLEGLQAVYSEIDKLERSAAEEHTFQEVEELFPQYALIAVCAQLLYLLLARTLFLKIP